MAKQIASDSEAQRVVQKQKSDRQRRLMTTLELDEIGEREQGDCYYLVDDLETFGWRYKANTTNNMD